MPHIDSKFLTGLVSTIAVILLSSFAGLVYQVQSVAQDVSYIKEQVVKITSDYDKFADKEETYNLIMLLINSRSQDISTILRRDSLDSLLRSVSDERER